LFGNDLLGMEPFCIVHSYGKILIAQIFNIYSWEIVAYQNYLLPQVVFFSYFPGFDKFTNLP
jgi:hypothetical protein